MKYELRAITAHIIFEIGNIKNKQEKDMYKRSLQVILDSNMSDEEKELSLIALLNRLEK